MDNQQQNRIIKYQGKVIKTEHYNILIDEYLNGVSLTKLQEKYGYNIATIRHFLMNQNIKIRNVKESVEKFHKISNLQLDNVFEENFTGWILGDGGLRLAQNSINPYFTYCDKHQEYIGECPVECYKYKWIIRDVQRL